MLRAELIKLKRSSLWVIAVILPLLAVTTGSLNYWSNRGVLNQAWASLFGQVFLFYGMFYLSMGVGLLAAAAWRMEHQGTNWNLLRTNTSNALSLILCKIVVIIIPVAFMQIILLAGTWIVGLFIVDNGTADAGQPPVMYLVAGLLAVLVAVPLVALQSLLSGLLRSFAMPVVICFLGCVVGTIGAMAPMPIGIIGYVMPQGIVARTLSIGSVSIGDGSGLETAGPLLLCAAVITAIVVAVSPKFIKMHST